MNVDTATIDQIVAGVLTQLAADGEGVGGGSFTETHRHGAVNHPSTSDVSGDRGATISANVITAAVLLDAVNGGSQLHVTERAIVTPAAWDAAKERRITITRQSSPATPRGSSAVTTNQTQPANSTHGALPVDLRGLLLVVRMTEAVEQLWGDVQADWNRELLGCPDDAAALAISSICRGDASRVVILAEQTHRAACLANRNDRVKAVAAGDAGEVRSINKQLRANVWCIDPTGKSWFELRNVMRAITN